MADKIGSTLVVVALILTALLLVAARSESLALETATPKIKRRSSRKEVCMTRRSIAGSALETAWAVGVSAIVAAPPSFP